MALDPNTVPEVPGQNQQRPMQSEKPTGGAVGSGAVHVENEHATIEALLADDVLLAQYAEEAANGEATLGVWESIKLYYPALGWALLCATCVIMEGYDTILIGNFFAYPAFANKYGTLIDDRGNSQVRQLSCGNQRAPLLIVLQLAYRRLAIRSE